MGFAQAIEQVGEGQNRVGQQHPWSSVAHHFPDFFAVCRCVTVYWAFATGSFALLERAMVQTSVGVGKEFLALMAEHALGLVSILAEMSNHYFDGSYFPLHAF